jgi:hypothetical protein
MVAFLESVMPKSQTQWSLASNTAIWLNKSKERAS